MTQPAPNQPNQNIASSPSGRAGSKRRVAFLGAGYIADWHAQSIAGVADVELVAVCDFVLPKAQAIAGKYGVPKAYGSLEAMLAAEKLDAVHVLLPPDRHFAAARTLLEAGVDVFLEKPMCDRSTDCDSLVSLAAERGLRLGVGHNFLFAEVYEQLRNDLRNGVLGKIDDITITWHRPLPPTQHGPFNIWMLRDPRNIMLEIGSHSVAHMLDLAGEPDQMQVHPSNAIDLPTGRKFYRRWQINASKDQTSIELRFSFVPGFSEYTIHVRGSLAAATVDFERNTYSLHQHLPKDPDFDAHAMNRSHAKGLKTQAHGTLMNYIRAKLKLTKRGNPYGSSIGRAMDAFYDPRQSTLDERLDGRTGASVIRLCEQIGANANLPADEIAARPAPAKVTLPTPPRVLVLGGAGFIGKELVRQLIAAGHSTRLLVRNPGNLPADILAGVECQIGDLLNKQDVLTAMQGIDYVFHLARANVKTWAEHEEFEIGATRKVAECALEAGVKRLIYTGTIASYYQGSRSGTITEDTILDPGIARGNFYAGAKTESEHILMRMHRDQGLPVVILRPGVVIGRGGSPFHWGVGTWWNDSVCQTWGDGKNKLPFVLVQDVAAGLIAAMEKPGVVGRSFNLVADPCLSAEEYLDELDRCGKIKIQRYPTPISKFYFGDLVKWVVKVAVRHPDRRFPSYQSWDTRALLTPFDCTAAKTVLGWQPVSGREELVRLGIQEPLKEFTE